MNNVCLVVDISAGQVNFDQSYTKVPTVSYCTVYPSSKWCQANIVEHFWRTAYFCNSCCCSCAIIAAIVTSSYKRN